ncbi:hypothetical protein HPB48_021165 [Haemaphysalis longicornis]|uniref:Bifunctional lysine-specific demethylase and histidyl-hydroxylase n=1 Tax=Haemaphysalis longicornis TaxID=44386 RepID=A0A9J6FTG2_HAELO|nr:hypothetical protein HPB48_021165 [Haemaphysalis longicornis]
MTKHWEREPLVCHSRDGHAEFWAPLFGKEMFFGLLKEKSIHFARDVAVCKYADGKRTDFERQGRVTEAKMRKLFQDDKATMQIHQPQRWVNGLWEALEMLECFFGCLVGCNAYVTPPVAQGLAPHYDDVEAMGDCLKAVAPDLIDAAVDSCAELRRGLPMQFLPHSRLSKAAVEAALEAVLNHVRKTQDVEPVAEDMVLDFMRTRLPPFGVDRRAISETTPDGKAPGVNDSVRFRYPSHVTYLLDDGTAAEGEDGTAEESSSYSLAEQPLQQHRGEKMVLLVTSVFNNREAHMVSTGGDEDEDDEVFEITHLKQSR